MARILCVALNGTQLVNCLQFVLTPQKRTYTCVKILQATVSIGMENVICQAVCGSRTPFCRLSRRTQIAVITGTNLVLISIYIASYTKSVYFQYPLRCFSLLVTPHSECRSWSAQLHTEIRRTSMHLSFHIVHIKKITIGLQF